MMTWLPERWQCWFGRHVRVITHSSISLDRHRQLHYVHSRCQVCGKAWVERSRYSRAKVFKFPWDPVSE
jgi:hypothetical protein